MLVVLQMGHVLKGLVSAALVSIFFIMLKKWIGWLTDESYFFAVTLGCGQSASQNLTFLEQTSVTSLSPACSQTVCTCSDAICRIRFDFNTLVLANAVAGTVATTPPNPQFTTPGDCVTDTFSIGGGSFGSSPVICGTNTGQHSKC